MSVAKGNVKLAITDVEGLHDVVLVSHDGGRKALRPVSDVSRLHVLIMAWHEV